MGTAPHLFILLFVLGLIVVPALVIATKPTKLGLDLKGGVQLVYQGQPTGQVKEVGGEDIEGRSRSSASGSTSSGSPSPKSPVSAPNEISVGLPDVTNAQRATEKVGTTAQLYFYDWEPNLIGREKAIGSHPGQRTAESGDRRSRKKNGRKPGGATQRAPKPAADLRRRLPLRLPGGELASEQEPVDRLHQLLGRRSRATTCSEGAPHKLMAGPEITKEDLFISPTGKSCPKKGRAQGAGGDDRRLRIAHRRNGKRRRDRQARLVRAQGQPGALGQGHHQPEAEKAPNATSRTSPSTSPKAARSVPGRDPEDRPARPGARDRPGRPGEEADRLSGHFAVVLDNKSRRGRSSTSPKTRTGSTAAPGRRSPAASQIARGAGPGDLPADRRPADQPEADQPDPGLGDARHARR